MSFRTPLQVIPQVFELATVTTVVAVHTRHTLHTHRTLATEWVSGRAGHIDSATNRPLRHRLRLLRLHDSLGLGFDNGLDDRLRHDHSDRLRLGLIGLISSDRLRLGLIGLISRNCRSVGLGCRGISDWLCVSRRGACTVITARIVGAVICTLGRRSITVGLLSLLTIRRPAAGNLAAVATTLNLSRLASVSTLRRNRCFGAIPAATTLRWATVGTSRLTSRRFTGRSCTSRRSRATIRCIRTTGRHLRSASTIAAAARATRSLVVTRGATVATAATVALHSADFQSCHLR